MSGIRALWRGDVSLSEAFWTWALMLGLAVNAVTSIAFMALISFDYPIPALLVGYGISLPYNMVAVVGVWRAAARYEGPTLHADLARGGTVALMGILSVT